MISRRLTLITWLFILWSGLLLGRLAYWQIIRGPSLRLLAQNQQTASVTIPAKRGEILYADGQPLVSNAENYLLYVEPKKLPPDLSSLLTVIDSLPASDSAKASLGAAKSATNLAWLSISSRVSPTAKAAIEALKLTGTGFEFAPIRSYPEGTPSAYISGFVGKNDQGHPQGYFGLEGYYNLLLSGSPGRLVEQLDAFGLPITIADRLRVPPKDGDNLFTSIDRTVQFIAFQQLSQALERYQSPAGSIIILESATGRVLAMVSLPGYDPAHYDAFLPELFNNPLVSDGFEPGSTFKTLVMAAALDAGAVKPETVCDICHGPVVIGDSAVRSYNDKYYPNSTMSDVILHSDNVGMVFVVRKLGKTRLLNYLRHFGIGSLTGIDLQEEAAPPLRPDNQWYDIDWSTTAFGQGIAVTPLQMVSAVNALANDGLYTPPRRVISRSSAAQITSMMVNGVTNGEVRYYKPAGYLIAGKTGTAQVPIAGHYDPEKVIASFVGFAPADDPKFTMLVTLRDPKPSPWGSTTAAPTWFNVAKELFRYYRIPPVLN